MTEVKQTGNIVSGDIAGRDIIQNASKRTPITELNECYIAASGNADGLQGFIEELQHFWNKTTNGDIRPLAKKLSDANRTDIIHDSEALKERATKIILKYQTSQAAQKLLSHILAELFGRFMYQVRPKIQEGADRATVDALFNDKVITETLDALEKNVLGLSRIDLMGLMYFLTGNCHIRWDKC